MKETKPAKKETPPTVGRNVHFYKHVQRSNGTNEIVKFAAIIVSLADKTANLMPSDMGVNLVLWTDRGDMQTRFSVRFSPEPKDNHWGWPDRV